MGNSQSNIQKINFEDIQFIIKNRETHLLINTLKEEEQECLIKNTINIQKEVEIINRFIQSGNSQIKIIIYGRNCNDDKIYSRYNQLQSLGFYNIYIYVGGLFEWLMLQDIYGDKEFPTTNRINDILKYKPSKVLNIHLLEY
jgi:hypothetical protein